MNAGAVIGVTPAVSDTQKPTTPGTPVVSNVDVYGNATVTVPASTDNVAVAGYLVYVDDNPNFIAESVTHIIQISELKTGTHMVFVRAFDANHNISDLSVGSALFSVDLSAGVKTIQELKRTQKISTFAILGDSISSQQFIPTSITDKRFNGSTKLGFWAEGIARARLRISCINHGDPGAKSKSISARAGDITANVCAVLAGTNDALSVTTTEVGDALFTEFKDNIKNIVSVLQSNSILVVLTTIPPNNNTNIFGNTFILLCNQWLKDYAKKNGLYILNLFDALIDPLSVTGEAVTDLMQIDGTHLSSAGSDIAADLCRKIVENIYIGTDRGLVTSSLFSDVSDTRINNISVNPTFAGSSGVKTGAAVVGVVANGWRVYDFVSGYSVACSTLPQVAHPLYLSEQGADAGTWESGLIYSVDECVVNAGVAYRCRVSHLSAFFATELLAGLWVVAKTVGNCQQMVITSTGTKSTKLYQSTNLASKFNANDVFQATAYVELLRPINVDVCELRIQQSGTNAVNGYNYKFAVAGGRALGSNNTGLSSTRRVLMTPDITIDPAYGDITAGNIDISTIFFPGGGSCIVRVSNATLVRK